jgi:DNA-binding NtrC family response regulator
MTIVPHNHNDQSPEALLQIAQQAAEGVRRLDNTPVTEALRSMICRMADILSPPAQTPAPTLADLSQSLADATVRFQSEYIHNVIQAEGNMSSAARRLGLHRSNLYRKMRQLGMEPPESAAGCASECDEATDIA